MSDGTQPKQNPLDVIKGLLPTVFGKPGTLDLMDLVDAVYMARQLEALFKARNKLLSEVLQAKMQDDLEKLTREKPNFVVQGGVTPGFTATRIWQKRLDTEKITEEMGADWVEDHKTEIDFYQFKSIKPGAKDE